MTLQLAQFWLNVRDFLSETWVEWLIYAAAAFAGYALYWYLFERRVYRLIDGRVCVRHGRLRKWLDLEDHNSSPAR